MAVTSKRVAPVNTQLINPVIPATDAVKYKATIDVLNKHFSGLIVLKQTDRDTKHLVFVTELGMRMFDFEIKGDNMKAVFVFEPLNKPKLINALTMNFKNMLLIQWSQNVAKICEKSGKEYLHLLHGQHNLFLFTDDKKYANQLYVFYKHKKESKTIFKDNYNNIKLKQYGLVKLFIELEKIND